MSVRLWDKGGATDAQMLRYTSRDDWQLDQRLLAYDLRATIAHVRGLGRIGVLSEAERDALVRELEVLAAQNEAGELRLTEDDEDGHSAIEAALVARIGDAGKKVHTGRSRNDQVLVATRLYERDALDELAEHAAAGARALLDLARREADTPMPGYTHLQRAVPSSVGYWAASFVEGLTDAVDVVRATRALVDRCPLGGAAGFGVNLPLDRAGVARELGFAGVAVNPLASQTSRGIIEAQILAAAWQVVAVIRRLAWDLSLFAMSELAFIRLPEAFTTGSSIMPQKRNPDVVELMRAACSVVQGALAEVQSIVALPSGYHRDLQLTKGPTMRGLDEALATSRLLPRLVEGLAFDRERMARAITPECFATDRAVELAVQGVPFREAYRKVAAEIAELPAGDAAASLRARVSLGAPGNLALDDLAQRLERHER
ncbi:argininosuccinate lyase [Sorangium sp. So ce854]|uniref:argininosuccinate lyase n=1 Tax=Sorangium sp. So ce854 TaxID=3133322 RepID=UPI003F5D615F